MNQEMYNEFKSPKNVTVIRLRRLARIWTPVLRMDVERTGKKLLEGKPGGMREKKDLD